MKPSKQTTNRIEVADWRGRRFTFLRRLILETAPSLVEDWKLNTPVWSYTGKVVAVGSFKDHLKVNFFEGTLLDELHGLFNAGLEAKKNPRHRHLRMRRYR